MAKIWAKPLAIIWPARVRDISGLNRDTSAFSPNARSETDDWKEAQGLSKRTRTHRGFVFLICAWKWEGVGLEGHRSGMERVWGTRFRFCVSHRRSSPLYICITPERYDYTQFKYAYPPIKKRGDPVRGPLLYRYTMRLIITRLFSMFRVNIFFLHLTLQVALSLDVATDCTLCCVATRRSYKKFLT